VQKHLEETNASPAPASSGTGDTAVDDEESAI
jgi:hypothetical protein